MDISHEKIIDNESDIEEGDASMDEGMDEEERNRAQAFSVKNQLVIWDMLINCRIKLQKALLNCNKLPQHTNFEFFLNADSGKVKESQIRAIEEKKKLMQALLKLDHTFKSSPGVEFQAKDGNPQITNDDHKNLLTEVNNVISEWWQKTSYATRSSKTDVKSLENEPSIIENINQILGNRERLLKKTRTPRSQYKILGKNDNTTNAPDAEIDNKSQSETVDFEIFDDDDFYGQLLRQLIESKTSLDSVDPITLSRQWLEVQKLRKKMKRKIDTRASKGRRLRYQVHQPLIGFMAPIENSIYEDDAKDALFASLFAQRKSQESSER